MNKPTVKKVLNAYKKAEGDYYFKYLDEAIYGLCKKYPDHKDARKIYAKISLVNNVYRANIQMSRSGAEAKLAEHLVQCNFDDVISPLKRIKVFDERSFDGIVGVHREFVKITNKALRITAISFCSKYLHFHFRNIIPIYDSRAYDTVWKLVGSEIGNNKLYDSMKNYDYAYYCASVLKVIEYLKQDGIKSPSLKTIDVLLYDTLYQESS